MGIWEKAFALYCNYPVATENTIERHMRTQLGVKSALVNSARRQQGLLHLYKRFCTQGRCGECLVLKNGY
jgi:aerobic-type carbon monoxide dehydrogenase small subunit (CoxS/CutS family)